MTTVTWHMINIQQIFINTNKKTIQINKWVHVTYVILTEMLSSRIVYDSVPENIHEILTPGLLK